MSIHLNLYTIKIHTCTCMKYFNFITNLKLKHDFNKHKFYLYNCNGRKNSRELNAVVYM